MGLKHFVVHLLFLPVLSGCLYASLPKEPELQSELVAQPDQAAISSDYNEARNYVRGARASYNCFLTTNEATSTYGVGGLLFAAGGAALGLAAAGSSSDSSLATAELGAGGGTGTGYWLWSRNKPKLDAYNTGRSALDCVSGQADQFAPNVGRYSLISQRVKDMEAPDAPVEKLRQEIPNIKAVVQQIQADPIAKAAAPNATQVLSDATNALTDADSQVSAAETVLSMTQTVPRSIVDQVNHIDTDVRQSAYTGIPDISTAGQGKLPTLPYQAPTSPSAAATPAPKGLQHQAVLPLAVSQFNAHKLEWISMTTDVVDTTRGLKILLSNVVTAPPDYGKCMTSLNQLIAKAEQASTPLQLLPPTDLHSVGSTTVGQVTISGSKQPYTFKPDNSQLQVSTTQTSSAFWIVNVTITDSKIPHTLAVFDSSGSQQSISMTGL